MKKIDYLIKVWGSLIWKNESFYDLIETLEDISKTKNIILTTGSKDISDIIRDRLKEIIEPILSLDNHIDITWKSRDIMSQVFCDISDKFVPIFDLKQIDSILNKDRIPVIIQYELLKQLQAFSLERWLSTDTSSAYFSKIVNAETFIKLTDVDWVYKDLNDKNSLLEKIYTSELKKMWKTCIGIALADFLDKINSICYVLNWNKSENLKIFLEEWKALHTKVIPNNWF